MAGRGEGARLVRDEQILLCRLVLVSAGSRRPIIGHPRRGRVRGQGAAEPAQCSPIGGRCTGRLLSGGGGVQHCAERTRSSTGLQKLYKRHPNTGLKAASSGDAQRAGGVPGRWNTSLAQEFSSGEETRQGLGPLVRAASVSQLGWRASSDSLLWQSTFDEKNSTRCSRPWGA